MAGLHFNHTAGQKIRFDANAADSGKPEATEIIPGYYAITNAFETCGFVVTEEGIVVIDSGISEARGKALLHAIRAVSDKPIRYLIYTHGHVDHVKGASVFKREGAIVIAQRNVSRRFRRYTELAGYHARINNIQGGGASALNDMVAYWRDFIYPDIEYIDDYHFDLGGKHFRLYHEYGETDDATVVAIDQDSVYYVGDLIISVFPNIGNPNKVIRYDHEWFEALDRIAAQNPQYVVPGHGTVLKGAQARTALHDTAQALRVLYEASVRFINEGQDLDYIIEHAQLPEELKQSPYLAEVYGNREFVLRGIHRRYTGWYDGNPSNLNPAPKADVAKAVFDLIGDREKILQKARKTIEKGELHLALHIIDLALGGNPPDAEALALKAEVLHRLGSESNNLFYVNFYLHEAEKLSRQGQGESRPV